MMSPGVALIRVSKAPALTVWSFVGDAPVLGLLGALGEQFAPTSRDAFAQQS